MARLKLKPVTAKLRELHGNVSATAQSFGVARQSMIEFIQRHGLQSVVDDARESMVDIAETMLKKAVLEGKPWAVGLTLKTLGRRRGYVERQEVTGKDGEPIEHKVFSYASVVDAIAPGPAEDHPAPGTIQGGGVREAMGEDGDV